AGLVLQLRGEGAVAAVEAERGVVVAAVGDGRDRADDLALADAVVLVEVDLRLLRPVAVGRERDEETGLRGRGLVRARGQGTREGGGEQRQAAVPGGAPEWGSPSPPGPLSHRGERGRRGLPPFPHRGGGAGGGGRKRQSNSATGRASRTKGRTR